MAQRIRSLMILILVGSFAALFLASPATGSLQRQTVVDRVEGELLVKFREGVRERRRERIRNRASSYLKRKFRVLKDLELVELGQDMTVEDALEALRADPDVEYAEPNYIVHTAGTPNDPLWGDLWGLNNAGQAGGTADADIDAPEAWDTTTGSGSVVVAVLDTGTDYNHEDLNANMFRNVADCNGDGVDDDGNGFIDDCYGIDTADDDSDPMDENGHGTHVSGTIGAVGNNGIGVSGVNQSVQILACKFLGADGSGSIGDAIDCLDYVGAMKDSGINIVATNNSWGGSEISQALIDAIDSHRQKGILFVAAAGNGNVFGIGEDNDSVPFYPCNIFVPNVLCVSATDRNDVPATFSNFGEATVDLDAPGVDILSTRPANQYGFASGTSMATPHVTGTAALVKAADPSADWRAIKNRILAGGDDAPLGNTTASGRRLNADGAIQCTGSTILSRVYPGGTVVHEPVGGSVVLAVLHINCAAPNGTVDVTVEPGGEVLTLLDDGAGADQAAGDGIYTAAWSPASEDIFTVTFPDGDTVDINTAPATLQVTPSSLDFGGVAVGASATRNLVLQNIGGGSLSGAATASSPFSVPLFSIYDLAPGQSTTIQVTFAPGSASSFASTVNLSGGDGVAVPVSGIGSVLSSISPNSADLASPPAGFTITGTGMRDFGFGLPVVNFYQGGLLVAQARAGSLSGTTLTAPYPTDATALTGGLPGLAAGTATVIVFNEHATGSWTNVGSIDISVVDTTPPPGVSSIGPDPIDLAAPPASFSVAGSGFAESAFGQPVVNFYQNGLLVGQARATSTSATNLSVPFPTNATSLSGPLAGLSLGTATVTVFNQISAGNFFQVGSTSLTVNDSTPQPGVDSIDPSSIDLIAPPASYLIAGGGFADTGFGLPVVNFYQNNVLVAQSRASAGSATSLTVPFVAGLSAGTATVTVFNQTGPGSWSEVGSTTLTVADTRPVPGVDSITPGAVDVSNPPASFELAGAGFEDGGSGLPVVNFYQNSALVGQARASAGSFTSLTVPYPTNATSLSGPLAGLGQGTATVTVFNQLSSGWVEVGSVTLAVTDPTPQPGVNSITPNPLLLASPPTAFTITGGGFQDFGFGQPVVNFYQGPWLVAQARATSGTSTTLTVPYVGGLNPGTITVRVFNQSQWWGGWIEVGSTTLAVQ